jgi:hypothetical protein
MMGEQEVWPMSDVTQVPDPDAAANGANAAPQQAPILQQPPTTQPASQPASQPTPAPQATPNVTPFDPAHAMTRLFVGVALEGSDELMRRLRRWEEGARQAAVTAPPAQDTSPAAEFRYAVIGLLLEGETRVRQGIQRLEQATTEATQRVTHTVDPNGWPAPRGPLGRGLDRFLTRRQADIARWREAGRQAEHEGRLTAHEALSSSTDEVFGYMAQEPQVRELIQEQGMTMASTALGEVRSRTATADRWVERVVRRALRMQPLEDTGAPTNAAPAKPTPTPPAAAPQVAVVRPAEPTPQPIPTPAAGRVQWAMDGPTEVC